MRCVAWASTSTATGLPFRVRGAGSVAGGAVDIDASASSQFVSGLLLAGPSFTDGLTVQHLGPALPSAPHIAMTVAMLRQAGVDVDDADAEPLAGAARAGRGAALAHRAGPVQRRPVHRRGRGQRGHGAHHRLAGGQHPARRRDPEHPSATELLL